ncbi:MAG: DUF1801 domain-containing protein [Anaerolineales bacterium]|nr:DUF1801 domain-containing protein [Anaerolineales bacterium]
MAELKTKPTEQSVEQFLQGVSPEQKRLDCLALVKLMREITGSEPRMWGSSMVGFGSYHYKYASGQEGDYFLTGFSPRKQNLTVYIMAGFDRYGDLMQRLGKYTTGKSCLYVKRLADVDLPTLSELIRQSVSYMIQTYPQG